MKINHKRKHFPNLKATVASYSPINLFVFFEEMDSSDLKKMRDRPFDSSTIENLKTYIHECRHYVDNIATLWGQQYLETYAKAIDVRLRHDIANYDSIVKFKQKEAQLYYATYYSETHGVSKVKSIETVWKWSPSVGCKFDNNGSIDESKPIPFIRFSNYDDSPVERIPLSISSLLETNSKAEEMSAHRTFLLTLSSTERPFHLKFFEKDVIFKLLYEQELMLYNVAVHVVANLLQITDFLEAFNISSAISTLSLNLPNEYAKDLPYNKETYEAWGNRPKDMLANNEYGFVYYILAENYSAAYKQEGVFNIESLLKSNGLPNKTELEKEVIENMQRIKSKIVNLENFSNFFSEKIQAGIDIFTKLGICGKDSDFLEAVFIDSPNLIFLDTDMEFETIDDHLLFSKVPFDKLNRDEWFNISDKIYQKMNELYEIRGI